MGGSDDGLAGDKQWAKKYILDPLTCPEPSDECGPGTSFRGLPQRSASVQARRPSNSHAHTLSDRSASVRRPEGGSDRPHRKPSSKSSSGHHHHHRSGSKSSLQSQRYPPSTSSNHSRTTRLGQPPQTQWTQGTILSRESSLRENNSRENSSQSNGPNRERDGGMASRKDNTAPLVDTGTGLHRSNSLSARYPGDMSHRPLDMIKKDYKSANRPHKTRTHRRNQPSDTIDTLDLTGPAPYHHDGPFDASMAARNANKRYSPLEALKDSNEEALKATPKEYIVDSLTRHVPLQGTAVVPPGMQDVGGRTMNYKEGADLMREADAPGGAYKRYDFIPYHRDDLKGKGEPSFTIERDRKDQKAQLRKYGSNSRHGSRHGGSRAGSVDDMAYEMVRPGGGSGREGRDSPQARLRSVSDLPSSANSASYASRPLPPLPSGFSTNVDSHRHGRHESASKKFAEGLKRRFGSLRRRNDGPN